MHFGKTRKYEKKMLSVFQRFIFVLQNFKLQSRIKQVMYTCDISIKVNIINIINKYKQ